MRYTILGSSGFIGHYLSKALPDAYCPPRRELRSLAGDLYHVFYCIGDNKLPGALDADLGYLLWFLKNCNFESLTYLSSSRVYCGASSGSEESDLVLSPQDPGMAYSVTKLAAESACLADERCKIVRLATVVGLNNGDYLIPGLIRSALRDRMMKVDLHPWTIRYLVAIEDVIEILPKIPFGKHRIYNIASDIPTNVGYIIMAIEAATGAKAFWRHSNFVPYPPISIKRAKEEFGFSPRPCIPLIPELCWQFDDVYVKQLLAPA